MSARATSVRPEAWGLWTRALAAACALAIILGSAFLWIGIPVCGFWLAGELTASATGFLFAALAGVPLAMVGFGFLLYRLNALYESLRGGPAGAAPRRSAWLVSFTDERASFRRARARRPLIDVAMTGSAVVALALLLVWFFFFAQMHLVAWP